jgi:hypothetical protein
VSSITGTAPIKRPIHRPFHDQRKNEKVKCFRNRLSLIRTHVHSTFLYSTKRQFDSFSVNKLRPHEIICSRPENEKKECDGCIRMMSRDISLLANKLDSSPMKTEPAKIFILTKQRCTKFHRTTQRSGYSDTNAPGNTTNSIRMILLQGEIKQQINQKGYSWLAIYLCPRPPIFIFPLP